MLTLCALIYVSYLIYVLKWRRNYFLTALFTSKFLKKGFFVTIYFSRKQHIHFFYSFICLTHSLIIYFKVTILQAILGNNQAMECLSFDFIDLVTMLTLTKVKKCKREIIKTETIARWGIIYICYQRSRKLAMSCLQEWNKGMGILCQW